MMSSRKYKQQLDLDMILCARHCGRGHGNCA